MSKCPECRAEITFLCYYTVEYNKYTYKDGKWNMEESVVDYGEYVCPECHKTLTTNQEEADKILHG